MTTYPLTFPTVGVIDSRFGPISNIGMNISPFSLKEQKYDWLNGRWAGSVTFRPVTHAQAGQLKAFVTDLNGVNGTFLYGDPDTIARGNVGTIYSALVNGAGQTGDVLNVDGLPINVTNAFLAGDYFQLGTGTGARLYMITANASTNASGQATLNFWPRLRVSPADNQAVIQTNPRGTFRLMQNDNEWTSNFSALSTVTISFIEVI